MSVIRPRAARNVVIVAVVSVVSCFLAHAIAQEATPRTLPPRVQEDVEAISRQLLNIQDRDVELSCPKAVENARYGLETALEVSQRNRDGGYLDAAAFDKTAAVIKARLAMITQTDCQAAQGGRLAFYHCMSSDYNHVMACAELDK